MDLTKIGFAQERLRFATYSLLVDRPERLKPRQTNSRLYPLMVLKSM